MRILALLFPMKRTKVKIRSYPISQGRRSLQLDYYPPIRNPETNKLVRLETLGMYIFDKPQTAFQREHNTATLAQAEAIRGIRQQSVINEEFGFLDKTKLKADFLAFFWKFALENGNTWESAFRHFERFMSGRCTFGELTLDLCLKYRQYIQKATKFRQPDRRIHINTAAGYFKYFKYVVYFAYRDKWIKENIANFGGDPENITVGGQSGGTSKAVAMVASPKMDVEVDRLILQSGLNYDWPFQTQESAEERGTAYLGDLGLDEATTLEDLRNMDAEKLIDSTSSNYPGSMNLDGLYVTYESIQDSINDGVFDEISVLSGTNMGEGSYPKVSTADDFYAQYKEALGDLYDKYDFENLVKVDDNTAAMVSRQLGTYGLGSYVSRNLMANRVYGKMMSERTDGKAVNYTYLFSQCTPESMSDLGTDRGWASQWAWHTSELWYAFNSLREGVPEVRQWRDWDYELAEKMNQYWSNFIKTGDPNGDGLAFWPEADENMGYIDLGAGISTHDEEMTDLEKLMMDYTVNCFNFPVAD